MDTVLWLCPRNSWNNKMAYADAHLNPEMILMVTV